MRKYAVILVVFGSFLWGTDSLFRRPLSRDLSPITIVFLEHCILSLVVAPFVLRAPRHVAGLSRRDWLSMAFIALGGSVAATSLFTFAIKYGNPSVTVLLQKTQPLFTILLARWLLGERPGKWFYRWVFPSMAGAYLVSAPDWKTGFALMRGEPMSLAAALGAALLWGSCTVLGRHIVGRMPVVTLTSLRFLLALPALSVLFLLQPSSHRAMPLTAASAGSLLGMAIIPGLAALLLYYHGLRSTIASVAALAELAFPLTAVLANWWILTIQLTGTQMLGGLILVSSVTALTYLDARDKACELQTARI